MKNTIPAILNPREKGGQILPMPTLKVNDFFFNIRANDTKLHKFFENLSGNNLVGGARIHQIFYFPGNQFLTGRFSRLRKFPVFNAQTNQLHHSKFI